MKTYITYLLKILSFSRNFRQFEMNNFLCWSAMVVDNISYGIRGVATNSGLGGGGGAGSPQVRIGIFFVL